MGHASTRAALIYLHATRDRDEVIAKALGSAFEEAMSGHTGTPSGTQDRRLISETSKARPHTVGDLAFRCWSGRRESNPRSQFGRLGLYH